MTIEPFAKLPEIWETHSPDSSRFSQHGFRISKAFDIFNYGKLLDLIVESTTPASQASDEETTSENSVRDIGDLLNGFLTWYEIFMISMERFDSTILHRKLIIGNYLKGR